MTSPLNGVIAISSNNEIPIRDGRPKVGFFQGVVCDGISLIAGRKSLNKHPHKHQLIYLTHVIKQRLRCILRRLRNRLYLLHLKRNYKRKAKDRKNFRRTEILQKRKQTEKGSLKKKGKNDTKGRETPKSPKPSTKSAAAPTKAITYTAKHHKKWRENKYRKWRRTNYRSDFIKRERKWLLCRKLHPATKPIDSLNFGWNLQEQQIRALQNSRTSGRWNQLMFPRPHQPYFKPQLKTSPYMKVEQRYSLDKTKNQLRNLIQTEWRIINHDRLIKNRLTKAVSKLILLAKEQFDKQERNNTTGVTDQLRFKEIANIVAPTNCVTRKANQRPKVSAQFPIATDEEMERENENQETVRKHLQQKIRSFLDKEPNQRLQMLKWKLLPRILCDNDIRPNTYFNRPKALYDCHLRKKLQELVISKTLRLRHLLPQNLTRGRMPLPFRRHLVGFVRPQKIFLGGAQMLPAHMQVGQASTKALTHILPYQRIQIKKVSHKRQKYPKTADPHFSEKVVKKPRKEKKGNNEKKKAVTKGESAKKGKSNEKSKSGGKGGPPRDRKTWKMWHRRQKRQRRKRKLRKWMTMHERRRRVKIAKELFRERDFKGKTDLRDMRKRIRELEIQSYKASQLINYLTSRNDYLEEQHDEIYSRRHSEYFAVFSDWRAHNDEWYRLMDQVDSVRTDMKIKSENFIAKCKQITEETNHLEDILESELSNFEIDYLEIMQFLDKEHQWEEEIANLETRALYYDFLYQFRESAEFANSAYVSNLLQRKMHADFMDMVHQERRRLRRKLPSASKRLLDERGLLAQEENKIRMWCNRLERRRDKFIIQAMHVLEENFILLRAQKHEQVFQRQVNAAKNKIVRKRMRRITTFSLKKVNSVIEKADRNLQNIRLRWQEAKVLTFEQAEIAKNLKENRDRLQAVIHRDEHQRGVYTAAILDVAAKLKEAFGIAEGYYDARWSSPKVNESKIIDTNAGLQRVLETLKEVHFDKVDVKFLISSVSGFSQSVKLHPIKASDCPWIN